jgi:hypothetical protein
MDNFANKNDHPRNNCHDFSLNTGGRAKRAPLHPGSSHGKVCVGGGHFGEIGHAGHLSTRKFPRNSRTAQYAYVSLLHYQVAA